jgi:hypothetical protein
MLDANQLAAIESAMAEEHRKDREALLRLKRFLPSNGSNSRVPTVLTITNEGDVEDNSQTIIDKVEEIMQADTTKKWTVPAMVAHLNNIKFPLVAKKPQATMGLVFSKLAHKRRTIRMVKKGSGRKPNWFRANPPQEEGTSETSPQSERAAS